MNEQTPRVASLLLVDDEPSILSSLRRLLRTGGYQIHTAESGRAGLDILEREPIDLVISDMRMPEMDGATFLEQVRERWPATTRILLTGYADISSTIAAINRGEVYRYVAKPWDDNDLLLLVRDSLESARLRNENTRLQALTQSQNEQLKSLNASLEDKVVQRTAEIEQINSFLNLANDRLKQNFLVSIKVFSGLMELRGGVMAGHSRRVADLVRKLARRLGVDPKAQQDFFFAALLHDIGKIGFPDSLLARPVAKTTGDDLARYRKHAQAGESALMPFDELKDVSKIVRWHHERYDGQGFPDGLQGPEIPLGARLLAVVNDYDGLQIGTLTEKRMTTDEAKAAIVAARGKRYDPQIVDAFVELLDSLGQEIVHEKAVSHADLKVDMLLSRDLVSREGALLLSADTVLNVHLIKQIQEYARREDHAIMTYIRTN
ncbi:MAG: response regulator receiver modulated metal dependent phosphohydrolase [Proteobacteria bacterium]|nr:response regulator receiver modulated metal dependent phosphohydrolase [Pseudomonadota bacterium]